MAFALQKWHFLNTGRTTPLDQVRDATATATATRPLRDATSIDTNNGSPLLPTFALPFFVLAWAYPRPLQLDDFSTASIHRSPLPEVETQGAGKQDGFYRSRNI